MEAIKRFCVLVVLVALVVLVGTIPLDAQSWKIMPIGNSITNGVGSSDGLGFRKKLYDKLVQGGVSFQFVGSQGTSPYNGHFMNGAKIQDFFPAGSMNLDNAINIHQPDVLMIHLGTNNMNQDAAGPYTDANSAAGKLYTLLNSTLLNHPSLHRILVCKIIPRVVFGVEDQKVKDYNAQIEQMFFDRFLIDKITVVDMYSTIDINSQLNSDGIHPNDQGYDKMSNLYSFVLQGINNNGGVLNGDNTKPSQIAFLNGNPIDSETAELQWTAPGDDGNSGYANLYELRYATFPLNNSNFSQGTLLSIKRPQQAGSAERATAKGLVAGLIYHFRIRTYDEMNNRSDLSPEAVIELPSQSSAGNVLCDDFNDPTLPDWSVHPAYKVSGGNLCNSSSTIGWTYLAVYKKAIYNAKLKFVESAFKWASSADDAGINASGIAMMLDNPNYNLANGYLVRVRDKKVYLEIVQNGAVNTSLGQIDVAAFYKDVTPQSNDTLIVRYTPSTAPEHVFNVYIQKRNGPKELIGIVKDPNKRQGNASQLYSGIMLYGARNNCIDNFCISVPNGEPDDMNIYAGNNQTGVIGKRLAEPLTVQVVDANKFGVDNIQVEFRVVKGQATLSTDSLAAIFNGNIWLEAEKGTLNSPMVAEGDAKASGGECILTPNLSGNYDKGLARFKIYIPKQGAYVFWLRVFAPELTQNSAYFGLPDTIANKLWEFKGHLNEWYWYSWGTPINLPTGFVDLTLRNREPGTKIDKILLSLNSSYQPVGKGDVSQRFTNITDQLGKAYTYLTFGTQSGPVEVTAYSPQIKSGVTRTFSEFASAGTPETIAYASDIVIQGNFNSALDNPFAIIAKDKYNNPTIAELAEFSIISGDGIFSNGNDTLLVKTDDEGIARALLTLATQPETKVRAKIRDAATSPAYLDFIGQTNILPAKIVLVDGNNQTAQVRQTLGKQLAVKILDGTDQPVAGYTVPFQISRGNGALNGAGKTANIATNSNGEAKVTWTLGDTAGTDKNRVTVNVLLQNAPMHFEATALARPADHLNKLSGENQTIGAGQTFDNPLIVQVVDDLNNPIANYSLKFSVAKGDGNFNGNKGTSTQNATALVNSNADGRAQVMYTSGRQTGLNEVLVEGIPALPKGSVSYTQLNVLQPPPGIITKISGDTPPQSAVVKSALSAPFKVRISDLFGSSLSSGIQVVFKTATGGGKITGLDSLIVPTNSQGEAQAILTLGAQAGTQAVKVYLRDYLSVAPVYFYAEGLPDVADQLNAGSDLVFNGIAGSGPHPLQVTVLDQYGNFRPGHPVQFSILSGGGYFEGGLAIQQLQTDVFGNATAKFYMGLNGGQTNLIQATSYKSGTVHLKGSPITFSGKLMPDRPAKIVKVSGNDPVQSAMILSTLTKPFVVRVVDQYQVPVPDVFVHFRVKSRTGKIGNDTESNQKADGNGEAFIFYTLGSTSGVESDSVEVTVNEYPSVPPLNLTATALAGSPEKMAAFGESSWTKKVDDQSLQVQPMLKISDMRDNPVANFIVSFQIIRGEGKVNGQSIATVTTDQSGLATVAWQLSAKADTQLVRAIAIYNDTPLLNSPLTFQAITVAGAPKSLKMISASRDTGAVNQVLPNPLVVQVTDVQGNAIPGQNVTFEVYFPSNGAKGKFHINNTLFESPVSVKTDKNGHALVYFLPIEGTNGVRASAAVGSPVSFIITGLTSPAQRIEIANPPTTLSAKAGSHLTVEVLAFDALSGGNLVDNQTVQFKVLDPHSTTGTSGTNWSVKKTQNGKASEIWQIGKIAGLENILEIDATNAGVHLKDSPSYIRATVTAADPFPDSCKIMGINGVSANGVDFSSITITLVDRFGNRVPGKNVVLQTDISGITVEQPATPTNAQGMVSAKIRSLISGPVAISARVLGDPEITICCAQIEFIADVASQIKVFAGNNQVGNVGAVLKAPLVAVVQDKNGNPVPGSEVEFIVAGGGGYLLESRAIKFSTITDSAGLALTHLVLGPEPNDKQFNNSAYAVIKGNDHAKALFSARGRLASSAQVLQKISGDKQTAQVGTLLPMPLVIQVLDADSVAIKDLAVLFTGVTGNGKIIGSNLVKTDHMGQVIAFYETGKLVGEQLISVSIAGGTQSQIFTCTAFSSKAVDLVPATEILIQDTVGTVVNLFVKALDEFKNPVANVPVHFQQLAGADQNGAFIPTDTTSTDQYGIAKARFEIGQKVGEYILAATSKILSDKQVSFFIQAVHDKPYRIVKVSGDGQYMTPGRKLLAPIRARIIDKYGNSISEDNVIFATSQNSGYVLQQRDDTDQEGIAQTQWVIGNQVGKNELWAIRNGVLGNPLTFTATAVANAFPEFTNVPEKITIDYTLYSATSPYTIEVNATDQDKDPLVYSMQNLPEGATFNPSSRMFSWSPKFNQRGTWTVIFQVEDNKTGVAKGLGVAMVQIEVIGNKAPIISSYFPKDDLITLRTNAAQNFSISVFDPDYDTLTFIWYIDGVEKSRTTSYRLEGKDFSHQSNHSIKCTISDGFTTVTKEWRIVIQHIELSSFAAQFEPFRGVLIKWKTHQEQDNLGFNIWRSSNKNGPYQRSNAVLIPSQQNGTYSFVDTTAIAGQTVYFKLEDVSRFGQRTMHGPISAEIALPDAFALMQNYPNPFNPETRIRFQLPNAEWTKITIFNTVGQVIRNVVDKKLVAGYHELVWDGMNDLGIPVSSGIYYVRIQSGHFKDSKKMVLLR